MGAIGKPQQAACMKVYKFGGASVRNAAGIRNLVDIVRREPGRLIVVVSAMGKTTNALERVTDAAFRGDVNSALAELSKVREEHYTVIDDLYPCGHILLQNKVEALLQEVVALVRGHDRYADYDRYYDQIVSAGELISTRIVSYALDRDNVSNRYMLMPELLRTDDTFREGRVDMEASALLIRGFIEKNPSQVYVAQGFVGGTANGLRTTLGREGSEYTAAVVANLTNAGSVTIWKDVPGILNADPRLFSETTLIEQLTYYDAVELAYSGAQVIHPKTIRPLENKQIPLYVRPFEGYEESGSVITGQTKHPIDVPVYIWRRNQVLLTLRPKDFSFVLEDCLNSLFEVISRHRLKVALIQSSAVTISVSVDNTRRVPAAIAELQRDYRVTFNEGLSLLTVRGTTPEIMERVRATHTILLTQTTRRTARFVVTGEPEKI